MSLSDLIQYFEESDLNNPLMSQIYLTVKDLDPLDKKLVNRIKKLGHKINRSSDLPFFYETLGAQLINGSIDSGYFTEVEQQYLSKPLKGKQLRLITYLFICNLFDMLNYFREVEKYVNKIKTYIRKDINIS